MDQNTARVMPNNTMNNDQMTQQVAASYVDDYMPPLAARPTSAPAPAAQPTQAPRPQAAPTNQDRISQTLEDQNIFHLLGVQDTSDSEKERFLDELQHAIWEDFLENDVDLLLTEEELVEFKKLSQQAGVSEDQRQGNMVSYLEKLIPDLEKIMLEKALDLKEEMMRERIIQLKKILGNQPEKFKKVQLAQQLIEDQKWRDAADELNSVVS
jgi:hypothetical protein